MGVSAANMHAAHLHSARNRKGTRRRLQFKRKEFDSRYTLGKLLEEVDFGSIRAGVHKADGKQPRETQSFPLEVALMKMVSKPFGCDNVLELMEWFEMSDCYILVLEQPSHCMGLHEFCKHHKG
ncbi:serine/threonine-protein kinase D2-like isoform X2 [Tachysurus ichikawai]